MKKNLIIPLLIVVVFGLQPAFAQFPIKIPKLPKVDKPEEQPPPNNTQQNSEKRKR